MASTSRMDARHIMAGTIGCPVCAAEYPVLDGVVDFRRGSFQTTARNAAHDPDMGLRLAALMNLTDAQGFAALLGPWGMHASALAAVADVPLILIDPPEGIVGSPGISVLRTDGLVPLAAGAARAMAIDGGAQPRIDSAVRATRATGRVIAPLDVAVPADVAELARDASMWVGERQAMPSRPIALHVRRS